MKRSLILAILGSLLLLLQARTAAADGPSTQGTIQMAGQVTVGGSQRQPRYLLRAQATDGSGWVLEASLTLRGERDRDESRLSGLSGQFTLAGPGTAIISGQVRGNVDRFGSGALQLADQAGNTRFDAKFSTDDAGQIRLALSGQFAMASDPQTSAAAQTQPVDHTFWYLSRATGLSAYLVLVFNVCLGLALSARFLGPSLARWQAFDLHQFTGFLALGLTALHAFTLLGDRYVGFTVVQLLVPFLSNYRPFWMALGIISLYLSVILTFSYYVRRWIGSSVWRALHYTTFGLYLMALAHSVVSGTDTGESWATLLYLGTGAVVAILALWRFSNPYSKRLAQADGNSSSQPQAVRS